ncbi:ClpX C4-type zinc finger protein [Nocardia bovistercoris]|uniref:ClpX C4-type zinc finger protein n=1 Tax=Nocardia bovistercoris TaxID=2785916 RepID=UPI002FCCF152
MNRCSFCNRSAEDVDTLVAGAGVYICDACVALSAEVIKNKPDGPKRTTPVWEGIDDDTLLAHLPRIDAIRHQVDDDLRCWVGEARRRGMSWDRVGEALGMRRQSAWERFS